MSIISVQGYCGGYSNWAKPTDLNIIGASGFRVNGVFGKLTECVLNDQVFIKSDHPQYKEIYSMVLAAYSSNKEVRFYLSECVVVNWISADSISTFSINNSQIDIR